LTPINFDILSTDPMPTAPRKRQLRNISELGGTETSLKQRPAAERVAAQDARPASGDKQNEQTWRTSRFMLQAQTQGNVTPLRPCARLSSPLWSGARIRAWIRRFKKGKTR
jgi:hypothetical protein